ncbi:MAG TPA: RNA polymerase sigma factor [Gemmatimonadaceae bacterium]|nr:RNA polymerase sigma factor [Gemmatimonadaceae bacterium]
MTEPRRTADEPDDDALIARWRSGDERAATLLVERHATPLARFVAALGERREVEEVVQDTFVRAFASLDGFRGESSLRTWLFTIARNLVRDRARSRKGRRDVVAIEDWHAATEHDALDVAVADEMEARMRRAVAALTPMQRDVFTLRVTEGMSYKEIAAVVSSTEGAARVHYHNAMRAIKEFLDE